MRTLYRTHFQIDAQLSDVASFIHEWALTIPKMTEADLDIWQADADELSAWRLRFASDRHQIEAQLAQNGDGLYAAARVMSADSAARTRLALSSQLIDQFSCRRDGYTLKNRAMQVNERNVSAFVRGIFGNPQRTLPIVALSRHDTGATAQEPDEMQRAAAGIALVAVWDGETSRALVRQYGRQFACYAGAVRVYRPNPQRSDARGHHRFFLWSDARASGFERRVLDLAADTALAADLPAEIEEITQNVRSATLIAAEPAEAMQALTADNEALSQDLTQTRSEVEQLRRERTKAIESTEALEAQVADLRRQLDQAVAYLAGENVETDATTTAGQQPQSVVEAVQLAELQFHNLDLFPNADDEAQRSRYRPAGKVLAALGTLNAVAELLQAGTVPSEQILHALSERGLNASDESEDTMHKYGDQRLFRNEFGHLIEMPLHVKLGAGSGADALCRIHFRWNGASGKIEVGHVGRHLQTDRS